MGKVVADMTVSLDGFVTGPNDGIDLPMGEGGERLHRWLFATDEPGIDPLHEPDAIDRDIVAEQFARMGAVIIGRRMFDHGEHPWGDTNPFGVPVIVITHNARPPVFKSDGIPFTFVSGGIHAAISLARETAGAKDVHVAGGASIVQQLLRAGLLDEMHLHLAPVVLGNGRRLFDRTNHASVEFEPIRVRQSRSMTHIRLRPRNVIRAASQL